MCIRDSLIASITQQCNLHCKGCYARANHSCFDGAVRENMTAGQWGNIFEQAAELGIEMCIRDRYQAVLGERYPNASEAVYDGFPSMQLDDSGFLFLLYDGITKDCLHYRYRVGSSQTPGLQRYGRLETQERCV